MELYRPDPLIFLKGQDLQSLTAHRDAITAQEVMKTDMARQEMQRRNNFLTELGKPAAPAPAQEGGQELQGPTEGGAPLMGSMKAATTPLWQKQIKQADTEVTNADLARKHGLLKEENTYRDNARQLYDDARQSKQQEFEQTQKSLANVAKIADSISDPFTYEAARRQAEAQSPGMWENIFGLPRDYSPQAQQRVKQIGQQIIDAKEAAAIKHRQDEIDLRGKELARKKEVDEAIASHRDAMESLRRAGMDDKARLIEAQIARLQSLTDATADKAQVKATKDSEQLSQQYRKESAKFNDNMRPLYETAARYVLTDNGKPKPTSAYDATQDSSLTYAYIAAIHPQHRGSVRELKDVEKLTSLPARVLQGVKGLVNGKELSETTRLEMFNAIKEKFLTENEQQAAREANTSARLKFMNPDADVSMYVPIYSVKTGAGKKPPEGKKDYSNLWASPAPGGQ